MLLKELYDSYATERIICFLSYWANYMRPMLLNELYASYATERIICFLCYWDELYASYAT